MTTITPTVGRKVWYYEHPSQLDPWDATVIKVWGSGPHSAVNLRVTDPYTGEQSLRSSVVVGDASVQHPHYRWMPYQQAQALAHTMHPAVAAAHPVDPPGI